VSLVAKIRGSAEGLYQQAKARYADSNAMQRAGKQAGDTAAQAGQAAGQLTKRVKDLAGKTSSAVKDARSRAATHK
jgi:hypothetical protein